MATPVARALSAISLDDMAQLSTIVPSQLAASSLVFLLLLIPQAEGKSLLVHAIDHDSILCIQYLIEQKANLQQSDSAGVFFLLPLSHASSPLRHSKEAARIVSSS